MRSRDLVARSPRSTPIVAGSVSDAKSRRDLAMARLGHSTTWQWHLLLRLQFHRRRLALSAQHDRATFPRGACLTPALLGAIDRHGARQPRDHVELEPQLD